MKYSHLLVCPIVQFAMNELSWIWPFKTCGTDMTSLNYNFVDNNQLPCHYWTSEQLHALRTITEWIK